MVVSSVLLHFCEEGRALVKMAQSPAIFLIGAVGSFSRLERSLDPLYVLSQSLVFGCFVEMT